MDKLDEEKSNLQVLMEHHNKHHLREEWQYSVGWLALGGIIGHVLAEFIFSLIH